MGAKHCDCIITILLMSCKGFMSGCVKREGVYILAVLSFLTLQVVHGINYIIIILWHMSVN